MDQPHDLAAEPPSTPALKALTHSVSGQLRPALVGFVILTLITGGLYPLVLFGIGRLTPDQANGGLIRRGGTVVGSRLIGQGFTRPEYFHPRPSVAGGGYDATQSGGTNLAPGNPKLIAAIRDAAFVFRRLNGLPQDATLPIDAVTSSGSGLDPDISPKNAELQATRVAKTRGLSIEAVRLLVQTHSEGRQFGLLGEPRAPVLELNLALDQMAPQARR